MTDSMLNHGLLGHSESINEGSAKVQSDDEQHWHVVRVRPRWEKTVREALSGKEYQVLLPMYRKRSRWSDRVREIELPLFPGYVFLRGGFSTRPRLITTLGVIGLLSFGGIPAAVTEKEIEAVYSVLSSGHDAEPWAYISEGDRVRVQSGALAGLEGILLRTKNEYRIVLSVDALCRSYAVEIDRQCVAPLLASCLPN